MKGPFERLRHDFKRTWECPECHQRRRTTGLSTSRSCNCKVLERTGDYVVMKLVKEAPPMRCPISANLHAAPVGETVIPANSVEDPEVDVGAPEQPKD